MSCCMMGTTPSRNHGIGGNLADNHRIAVRCTYNPLPSCAGGDLLLECERAQHATHGTIQIRTCPVLTTITFAVIMFINSC
jgi:hypothetical protein